MRHTDSIPTTTPMPSHAPAAYVSPQPDASLPSIRIRHSDGGLHLFNFYRLVRFVDASTAGLDETVDAERVARNAARGFYDGIADDEVHRLTIAAAAYLIGEDPAYSRLAARLLMRWLQKEAAREGVARFSDSVRIGHENGLISDVVAAFVAEHTATLDAAVAEIEAERNDRFQYFGLRTVADRYLLRQPHTRRVLEMPQHWLMRVACGLSETVDEALEVYRLTSSLAYLPSSPTLFNSGTRRSQMSSCYLLDSPADDLDAIYETYQKVARLSKWAGGIGLPYHRVRSRGSLIRGTNGLSNGIIPWLKTLDSSVAAVNQGGRRKGACCVYLESWHADVEEFLELRDNTGDEARRAHNLNLANWIPDLFMQRVQQDGVWSLFDPKKVPHFCDLYGEAFEQAYLAAEAEGQYERQVKARDLYSRMMRTLAETGNGWMTFKDRCNTTCNQTAEPGRVVHSSNLCTEIVEVTSAGETAVCNLGSINLGKLVKPGTTGFMQQPKDRFDWEALGRVTRTAVKYLDRVIDRNFYPTEESQASNAKWRPVGLGCMGLQDVFFQLEVPFDSDEARKLSRWIAEEIYYHALAESVALAEQYGPHPGFAETRAARGELQFDYWAGAEPRKPERWAALRERVQQVGLRNSLLIAIAPTATIASICGCYECIEPQVSNLFKRETLSGEFLQVNHYLVEDLKKRNLWTPAIRDQIKRGEGSIQHIEEIPEHVRKLYRTCWELPQRALIDMAADRGAYIDQSQSLNLFIEAPTIGKLSSMYLYAWHRGLKTTYYLRSRPATRIRQTTILDASTQTNKRAYSPSEAVACSLENPEYCEACQ